MKTSWKIGDCLELMHVYEDNHFDLLLTDPPYGIGVCKTGKMGGDVLAKNTDFGECLWDDKRPNPEYFDEMIRISKNQVIFGGNYYADCLPPSACWIVWDKENGANNFADCELAWTSFESAVRIFRYRWQGMLQGDMAHKEKRVHPTQKPIALFEWILKKYTSAGDLVCDPFLGSGTTLSACRRTDRCGIGFEINPEYEHIISDRCMAKTPPLTGYFK